MQIGGFQKLTLLDFPGQVACIVFTMGCNFRCPFCQNAGLVLPDVACEEITPETVLAYLQKRRNVLDGVVISGGEPLLQPDCESLLRDIRAQGYKIKLDTNGSFPLRLQAVLEAELVDYVAMDIKQAPSRYESACGIPGERVVQLVTQSLQILRSSGVPYELRTTVVKGIHTKEDLAALAAWIAGPMPYYLQSYEVSEQILKPDGLSCFTEDELEGLLQAVRPYCPQSRLRK